MPPERLAKSIALNSSAFTTAVIAGPALGGFLFVLGPVATYSVCMAGFLLAAVLMRRSAAGAPSASASLAIAA